MGSRSKSAKVPQRTNDKLLANDFKDFFITKVERNNEIFNNANRTFDTLSPVFPLLKFVSFQKVIASEILEILSNFNKSS